MSTAGRETNFFSLIGAEVERMFNIKQRRNSEAKSPNSANADQVSRPTDAPNEPVILNVYDMHWTNKFGVGIFHSGVEVYGTEYAFGGHPWSFTGIFEIDPRNATELNEHFKFKESIELGRTDFTRADIVQLIESLGEEYQGLTYHLLRKNCNHFSAAFAKLLCGKTMPKWVNRLAEIAASIPFLERSLPKEWLTPVLPEASQAELLEFFQQHAALQALDFDDLLRMSATTRATDGDAALPSASSSGSASAPAGAKPNRRSSSHSSARTRDSQPLDVDDSEEVRADDDVCGANSSRSNTYVHAPRR